MKNKNVILASAAVLAFGATSLTGLSLASAATSSNANDNLADKIASKFNLNKDEVQKVFDEEKSAREAERQKDFSERLQKKVDSGDITVQQKTLIENKMKELQTKREAERKNLETWASDNKIDLKYLHGLGRHGNDSRLQDAVDDNDITAEQKTLIENKLQELEGKRNTEKDALEKWADDNKIDLKNIIPFGGVGHGRGFGGPGRH